MDGGFDGQMFSLAEVQAAFPARRGGGGWGRTGVIGVQSLESFELRTYMDVMRTKQRKCSDSFRIT